MWKPLLCKMPKLQGMFPVCLLSDMQFVLFLCSCTIDWKKGKNVTVRVVKKVQKHKKRGTKRTITQTVKNDSIFNFFDPPEGFPEVNI